MAAPNQPTGRRIVVVGGTGFVGMHLAQMLRANGFLQPAYVVHRNRPDWLATAPVNIIACSLSDTRSLRTAFDGADVVVNLLRPDGGGWYGKVLGEIIFAAGDARVGRFIHAGSIDIYGDSPDPILDEESDLMPKSAYAMDHHAAENAVNAMPGAIILRLGAIFGPGGQNIIAFAREAAIAPDWRLAARRMLYGHRRMHLVSLAAVCGVIGHVATCETPPPKCIVVTDDDDERNNFAFMQGALAHAFGRRNLDHVPILPDALLMTALRFRGRSIADVRRRFSLKRLNGLCLARPDFGEALIAYARSLAACKG